MDAKKEEGVRASPAEEDFITETNLKESGTSRRGGEHDPQPTPGFCLASYGPPATLGDPIDHCPRGPAQWTGGPEQCTVHYKHNSAPVHCPRAPEQ